MKKKTACYLASLSCTILLVLFAFLGKPDIVFESVWAEMFFAILLFLGAGIFLYAAIHSDE